MPKTTTRRQEIADRPASATAPSKTDSPHVDVRQWIARRASERFQMRGGEPGRDQEDWFEAEREVTENQ